MLRSIIHYLSKLDMTFTCYILYKKKQIKQKKLYKKT